VLERVVLGPQTRTASATTWLANRATVIGWWAGSRLLVLAAALSLHWSRAPRGYFGRHIFNHALGLLEAWDGVWYRRVAEHGYLLVPGHQSDPAFFPLYPMLLKALGALGVSTGAAGVVLSNLLILGALLAFDALGRELFPSALARRATLLLAVFPTSYVCSMVYPESLVLLAFALAGLFALRRKWLACAFFAAVAGLARPEGALLLLPIGAAVIARRHTLAPEERGRALAAALSAPAAALSFPLYLGWALHDPLAWSKAQQAWGRSFRLDGIVKAIQHIAARLSNQPWTARDLTFCVLTLLLLWAAWRAGAPRGWIALGVLIVLLPLGSGSFASDARFALLALPAYWGLAWLCRDRRVFAVTTALSVCLLVAATLTLPLVFP
jgi:Mannosyltransferase (PIG-V)